MQDHNLKVKIGIDFRTQIQDQTVQEDFTTRFQDQDLGLDDSRPDFTART